MLFLVAETATSGIHPRPFLAASRFALDWERAEDLECDWTRRGLKDACGSEAVDGDPDGDGEGERPGEPEPDPTRLRVLGSHLLGVVPLPRDGAEDARRGR